MVFLLGLTIAARLHEVVGKVQVSLRVVLLVAYHVAIGSYGSLVLVDLVIAVCHHSGALTSKGTFLRRSALVGSTKFLGCIVIFAQGEILLTLLHVPVGSAGAEQQA